MMGMNVTTIFIYFNRLCSDDLLKVIYFYRISKTSFTQVVHSTHWG